MLWVISQFQKKIGERMYKNELLWVIFALQGIKYFAEIYKKGILCIQFIEYI